MINRCKPLGVICRKHFAHLLGCLILPFLFHAVSAQQIVFDLSRNQPLYLHDDGYAGSSLFAKSLYGNNYRVSVNQLPLHRFLESNNPDLLVLVPTVFQYHGREEVVAVQNYVKAGGNLLIFAEHENFFKSSDNLNRFIEGSGIRILPDKAEFDNYRHFAERFRPHAITPFTDKDSVIFFLPATLELKDSTHSMAKTVHGQHLAAIAPFGSGKIGVITDFEIIWNMSPITGYRYGQNDLFVHKMIQSLIGGGSNIAPTATPKKKNIWLQGNCFELDLNKMVSYKPLIDAFVKQGYGIRFSSEKQEVRPTGNDIYIGLCACDSEWEKNFALQFKKMFLVGYNKSDFWKNITKAFEGFKEKGFDIKPMEESLNSIWKYDEYEPISWQDSLEMALGLVFSRKLSYTDSIHLNRSVLKMNDLQANGVLGFNIFSKGKNFQILVEGSSRPGVYYPAPSENNIILTEGEGPITDHPVIISEGNYVVSAVPALFRSDYPDKKFQEKVIKKVLEKLSK